MWSINNKLSGCRWCPWLWNAKGICHYCWQLLTGSPVGQSLQITAAQLHSIISGRPAREASACSNQRGKVYKAESMFLRCVTSWRHWGLILWKLHLIRNLLTQGFFTDKSIILIASLFSCRWTGDAWKFIFSIQAGWTCIDRGGCAGGLKVKLNLILNIHFLSL